MKYTSTSFQSDHTSAPLYDLATNPCTQLKLSPNKTPQEDSSKPYEPELGDYSHLSHSRPSTQKLLKTNDHSVADQQLIHASTQLYDTADEIQLNQQPRVKSTKSKQSVQYAIGKASLAIIIVLQVLILVCVMVMIILTNNNGAGLNSANKSTCTILQLLNTSLIKDISIPTAATVNDILLVVNELLELQNGSSLFNSIRPVSCKDIKAVQPNSPTGYYHVNSRNIYCNMERLCSTEGGWTRLAYLDMSDNAQNCPSGLQAWFTGGIRVCRRQGNSAGCRSIKFPTNGISYTQICGRVIGYQKGTTDGVNTRINNINDAYIDGVSITRGSPREHVWSYISGLTSNTNYYPNSNCPCNTGVTKKLQQFVGNHYYCESGNKNSVIESKLYTTDPLWDGNNCSSPEAPCCSSPNLPWFFRDYGNATSTDYLELRVCGNKGWKHEDTPVQLYEIYVN